MNNDKQSSVEWFSQESWKLKVKLENQEITIGEYGVTYVDLLKQAKAMHKEEIIITWHKGYNNLSPMIDEDNCGDKYYNETYGGNNE